jgi:uncharacterized lipoprotein YajG
MRVAILIAVLLLTAGCATQQQAAEATAKKAQRARNVSMTLKHLVSLV